MSWLLIFSLYSGGHLDTMQQAKFSTKEMCIAGASQISKTFSDKSDMFKWTCISLKKSKEKEKKHIQVV